MPDPTINWSKVPGLEHMADDATAQPAEPQIDWSKVPGLEHMANSAPSPQVTAQPGLFERLGGWRGLGALATRLGAGVGSSIVGAVPSPLTTSAAMALGAGGESLAEKLAGQPQDPKTIALEGAISGIPLGKIFKAGEMGLSALRAGGLGAAHEAASELMHERTLDPSKLVVSSGLGALTGFLGGRGDAETGAAEEAAQKAAQPTKQTFQIETTAQPGGRVLGPSGGLVPVGPPRNVTVKLGQTGVTPDFTVPTPEEYLQQVTTTPPERVPYGGSSTGPAPYRASAKAAVAADIKAAKAAQQAADQAAAEERIREAIEQGMQPATPSVSERVTATIPGGKRTLTQRYEFPEPEDGETKLAEGSAIPGLVQEPQAPAIAPAAERTPEQQVAEASQEARSQIPSPSSTEVIAAEDPVLAAARQAFEEKAAGLRSQTQKAFAEARSRVASPSSSEQPPTGESAEPSALAKFFKTPVDAIGAAAAQAKAEGAPALVQQQLGVAIKRAAQEAGLPTTPGVANLSRFLQSRVSPAISADWGRPPLPITAPRAASALEEARAPKLPAETPVAAPGPESPAPSTYGQMTNSEGELIPYAAQSSDDPRVVAEQQAIVDQAANDPEIAAMLRRLAQEERGSLTLPAMRPEVKYRLLGALLGTGTGGAIGAYENPDDPLLGGLKGAGMGMALGAWTTPGEGLAAGNASNELLKEWFKNLVDLRRSSFLAAPGPILKKAIVDPAGMFAEGVKSVLPGEGQDVELGKNLMKGALTLYNPKEWEPAWSATTGGATDIGQLAEQLNKGTLGIIHKPLEFVQNLTSQAMERAGASPEQIGRVTGTGTPETGMGQEALHFVQKHPIMQYLQPFSKIPIHIAEGVRNLPGVAQYAYGPEEAGRQALVGTGNMALGALEQLYNEAKDEQGAPVPPLEKAIQSGVGGLPYVMPNLVGKALASYLSGGKADALKELLNTIPGGHLLPTTLPGQTTANVINNYIKRELQATMPSLFAPETGTVR